MITLLDNSNINHQKNLQKEYVEAKKVIQEFVSQEREKVRQRYNKMRMRAQRLLRRKIDVESSHLITKANNLIQETQRRVFIDAEQELANIALSIAEKALRQQLTFQPDVLKQFVEQSIQTHENEIKHIELHPSHSHALQLNSIPLHANSEIPPGCMRIILKTGAIECSVFDMITQLKKTLHTSTQEHR